MAKRYTDEFRRDATLLRKSADGRRSPFPGQTQPVVSVMGMPSAV